MTNIDGIKYLILNPYEKNIRSSQDLYLSKYNECYNSFITYFIFEDVDSMFSECESYTYVVNCYGNDDIINKDDSYEYKFLKSMFIKTKRQKILDILSSYYRTFNTFIKSFYYLDGKIYMELARL